MQHKLNRGKFLSIGGGALLGLTQPVKAGRFATRYRFAVEMVSAYSFLVDPIVNQLSPHPSIAADVRSGALRSRQRFEFPYAGGDTMRALIYYEDPNKPLSGENNVPAGDPRVLIEILTDVTSILVKDDPVPHFTVMGLVIENPTSTFFGNLTSRITIFSASMDRDKPTSLTLAVVSTGGSHVLAAQKASGTLYITEGGLR